MPAPAPAQKTSKELREDRSRLVPRMRELRDRHHAEPGWTDEDRQNWEKTNAEYDELTRQIDQAEARDRLEARLAEVEAQQRAPASDRSIGREDLDGRRTQQAAAAGLPTDEDRRLAFQGWCRAQMDLDVEERHEEAAARCGLKLHARRLSIDLGDSRAAADVQRRFRSVHPSRAAELLAREGRALSGVLGSAGGALIPEGFVRSLEVALLAFGGIRQTAEILRTETGEPLPWPTANDTGNKGRRIGENQAVDATGETTAEPTFAQTVWNAYKYTSDAILVPQELLEDSAFDLASVLGGMLGERLARIENAECTTGTGNAMPKGLVTAATLGVTAASATAITADELIQLEHSVDPAYRVGAGYMFHDNVLLAVRLLKDNEGRYLWQSNIREGVPDLLNGRPITINQDMAGSIAAGAKTILFGQLNRYKLREVRGVRLYRLQERYRDSDQDGFVAFMRLDGNLLDAGTHPVKYLQQAAS